MWRSVSVVCAGIAAMAVAGQAGVAAEHARDVPPKALALLVDTSQAMVPHVNALRSALRAFVREMQPTHEIAIIEFGERPTVLDGLHERSRAAAERRRARVRAHWHRRVRA